MSQVTPQCRLATALSIPPATCAVGRAPSRLRLSPCYEGPASGNMVSELKTGPGSGLHIMQAVAHAAPL